MSEIEKAISDFLEEMEGKREPVEVVNQVTKIEFMPYGDIVHYEDGTTHYRSIED